MSKTKEQLIIENEELHSRLAETEETLIAIRSGEVDAIVVSGAKENKSILLVLLKHHIVRSLKK